MENYLATLFIIRGIIVKVVTIFATTPHCFKLNSGRSYYLFPVNLIG